MTDDDFDDRPNPDDYVDATDYRTDARAWALQQEGPKRTWRSLLAVSAKGRAESAVGGLPSTITDEGQRP